MSYYPIGKAVPPPGGSGGWGSQGGQGGAGGWAPPPNAGGAWAPPSGSWAAPSGSWAVGGGGYPPNAGGGAYPNPSNYPPSYPNQPPKPTNDGGWQPGMNQPSSGPYPSQYDRPGNYPTGPSTGFSAGPSAPYPPSGGGANYPPSSNFGGGAYPPGPSTYPSGPPSYPAGPSPYPSGPSAYPSGLPPYSSGPSPYPPGPSTYPSGPPGGVYPPGPPGGNGYPPAQPGYSPFSGGQNIPTVVPQTVPTFNSGDNSEAYKQAIEYFKSMSDQDMIPEEGRGAFMTLAGIDGAVDAYEMQDILNKVFMSEFKFDGFSADMTRSLVAMRDYDLSGKLGFDGFRGLWTDLAWCKRAFVMFDVNKSGAFCKNEFTKALETMGLTVTPKTHKAMLMRYTDKDGNIRFDDFVLCYIRLKTMMTVYQSKDPQGQGFSDFERDEFVQLAIYS